MRRGFEGECAEATGWHDVERRGGRAPTTRQVQSPNLLKLWESGRRKIRRTQQPPPQCVEKR